MRSVVILLLISMFYQTTTPTSSPSPSPLSPVDVTIHEQRVWFTWTDTGASGYTIELEGPALFTFWVPRTACQEGICSWQSPAYLEQGQWTWRIIAGDTTSSDVTFRVEGNVIDSYVVIERRIDYGDFITAAGFTALALIVAVWIMFDVVHRTLLRRIKQ